jgi:hypothetical protein
MLSFADLTQEAATPVRWLWDGYLAGGAVTLLTSRWKAGKTTLVSVLLARMGAGGELAGRAVAAGRAAVVSEESSSLWVPRARKLGLGGHVRLLAQPFPGRPSPADWAGLIDCLLDERTQHGLDLAVIDPLAVFLPGPDENNAISMLAGLNPLRRLTAAGMAVLILHHPRKADERPRGSGALSGFVDILIEMSVPRCGGPENRQRRLQGAARFSETPRDLRIELTADGTDYRVVPGGVGESFTEGWAAVAEVLTAAGRPLTRRELLARWPDDSPPEPTLLWRCLERAVAEGLAERTGTGLKSDPFRYWVVGRNPAG